MARNQSSFRGRLACAGRFSLPMDAMWDSSPASGLGKTRVDGGEPTVICDATELLGASWGDDGSIIGADSHRTRACLERGRRHPEPIPPTPVGARWPQVLPGSKAVLFTAGLPAPGRLRIDVLSLADGTVKTLMEGVSHARYLASGHLAWVARQTLFVAPFDSDRLALTGPAVPVIEDIAPSMYGARSSTSRTPARSSFAASPVGVCRRSTGSINRERRRRCSRRRGINFLPSISPDGSRLAFSLGETPRVEDFQILDLRSSAIVKPVTAGIRAYATWLPPSGRFLVGNGSSGEDPLDADRWFRSHRHFARHTRRGAAAVVLRWQRPESRVLPTRHVR